MSLMYRRVYYVLALIPFLYIVLLPLINRVEPRILGLPFLWITTFIWAIFVSLCMLMLWLMEGKTKHE